jgi:hypothetical protein
MESINPTNISVPASSQVPSGNDLVDAIFSGFFPMGIIGVLSLIGTQLAGIGAVSFGGMSITTALVVITGLLQARAYLKSIGKI